MSPPEVVLVDPGCYTPQYDLNLAHALGRGGWRVRLVTSTPLFEELPLPGGLDVRRLFFDGFDGRRGASTAGAPRTRIARRMRKALAYPSGLKNLDRHLAAMRPGIIHVQWALLPLLDARWWRRWRRRGWRIVYTAHDVYRLPGTTPALLAGQQRLLFSRADAVICHTRVERARALDGGAAGEKTFVVPQGSPGIFLGEAPEREAARRGLGLDVRDEVVLFFGFIKPYKGLDLLLGSFSRLREERPRSRLVVAGEPLTGTAGLERLRRRAGLDGALRWLPAYVPHARVPALFAAADVVALPYRCASSSAVLTTAFGHGRPVAAAAAGGLAEIVEEGRTGLTFPPGDEAALAAALASILADPDWAAVMGERAKAQVRTRHAWEGIAGRIGEIYRRLSG